MINNRRILAQLRMLCMLSFLSVTLIVCNSKSPTDNSDDGSDTTLTTGDTTGDDTTQDTTTNDTTSNDTIPDTTVIDTFMGDSLMTFSPMPLDSITDIVPLGNLNPPSHTFPTDHIYLYMPIEYGDTIPPVITLYSPGNIRTTELSASEHVNAGFTDYSIRFKLLTEVDVVFGHVTSLDESVFGDVSSFVNWTLLNEYSTGGETYRLWTKDFDTIIEAGTVIGTVGGNPHQYALDIGVYDTRVDGTVANVSAWQSSWYVNAACPFDYYADGSVRDDLITIMSQTVTSSDPYPCGLVAQDVPGTAQGIWFYPGEPAPYPEDPHLAMVWYNMDPSRQAFSLGTSVPAIGPGVFTFSPVTAGRVNLQFDQLSNIGTTYAYWIHDSSDNEDKTIIIRLTDDETLEIDALMGALSTPSTWTFSDSSQIFER